jgi:peptidoglycan-associated lipoprotein
MRNEVKVLLKGLFICCLAFSLIGGCRHKGGAETPTTDIVGREIPYETVPIDEEAWQKADPAIYQTIYFDLDKSAIRPEFQPVLEAVAENLKANPQLFLRCVGHCCDRGTNEYNFGLGERRAASVRAYLVALGIEAGRIRTLSKGEEEPAVPNTEEQQHLNRRVEFWAATETASE